MDAGLVTSLSGALAQARRVDKIANNIANADTPAFKADDLIFEESLLGAQREDGRTDIPEREFSESELMSRAGDEHRAVLYGEEFTDLKAGAYKVTHNPLDIAIEGNGFLEILTPSGIRLTRAGNLALDAGGRLITRDGFLVLASGGRGAATAGAPRDLQADAANAGMRAITVGSGNFNIDSEGNVYSGADRGGGIVGQLSLVRVENPRALKKEGSNLYSALPEAFVVQNNSNAPVRGPAGVAAPTAIADKPRLNPLGSTLVPPRVHQGMIEGSNVNPVAEMTKLIEAQRLFEQNTKLMQTMGDISSRVSEIGKF